MKGVRQVKCLGSKFNSLSFAQLEASGKGYIELPHTWTCNAVGTHISKSAGGWLREGRGIQVAIQVPALWIEISGISIPGISRICRHGVRDAMRPGVVARHGNAANGTALNRKDQTLITRRGTAVDAIYSSKIFPVLRIKSQYAARIRVCSRRT